MNPEPINQIKLPSLKVLGKDLLELSFLQKLWTISKPFIWCFAYLYFASQSFISLAFLSVIILMFVTYVSTSHDLVHGTLKLKPGINRFLLSITEMLVLRSGHAFKISHMNHHLNFPKEEDIEGSSVHKNLVGALMEGPLYLYRLYFWALKHTKDNQDRRWLVIEGVWFVVYFIVSILTFDIYPFLLYYFILVQLGSWVYPLFTVYIPHKVDYRHPIFQTKVFRGPIISFVFAHHNYHLEHHLYPMVPHQNWRKLSKRLSSYLEPYDLKTIIL